MLTSNPPTTFPLSIVSEFLHINLRHRSWTMSVFNNKGNMNAVRFYASPIDGYNNACAAVNNGRFGHAMAPQVHPHSRGLFQDFEYFVVIDFEATCEKGKVPFPQEIIEFPSVVVNGVTGQIQGCFQTYVRPTHHRVLSDFCKDLTGIQQDQVDKGVTLIEALARHDEWLEMMGIKNANFAIVTWSDWDCKVMLESECHFKNISKPSYFNRWINLRVPYNKVFGNVRCNLKEAVERTGLIWQGRQHCGLDDAKNTAHLLGLLVHKGVRLSITGALVETYRAPCGVATNTAHLLV